MKTKPNRSTLPFVDLSLFAEKVATKKLCANPGFHNTIKMKLKPITALLKKKKKKKKKGIILKRARKTMANEIKQLDETPAIETDFLFIFFFLSFCLVLNQCILDTSMYVMEPKPSNSITQQRQS